MGLDVSRRSVITGLISLIAAPAIVRAGSLMPVKAAPVFDLSEHSIVWTACGDPNLRTVFFFSNRTFFVMNETGIVVDGNADMSLSWDAADDTGRITLA